MSSNRLKLKADKTEFIWLETRQHLAYLSQPLIVDGQHVEPVQSVRNFGVTLDDQLTMDAHSRSLIATCCFSQA
jgi:hypothetical protein